MNTEATAPGPWLRLTALAVFHYSLVYLARLFHRDRRRRARRDRLTRFASAAT